MHAPILRARPLLLLLDPCFHRSCLCSPSALRRAFVSCTWTLRRLRLILTVSPAIAHAAVVPAILRTMAAREPSLAAPTRLARPAQVLPRLPCSRRRACSPLLPRRAARAGETTPAAYLGARAPSRGQVARALPLPPQARPPRRGCTSAHRCTALRRRRGAWARTM